MFGGADDHGRGCRPFLAQEALDGGVVRPEDQPCLFQQLGADGGEPGLAAVAFHDGMSQCLLQASYVLTDR